VRAARLPFTMTMVSGWGCRGSARPLLQLSVLAAVAVLGACSSSSGRPDNAGTQGVPSPPAVSGVDDTVWVQWALADTFDVRPGGRCEGRASFRGMGDGSRVVLRGNSTGWDVEGRATAYVDHREPYLSHGQPLPDDNVYCDIRVVFSPSMPDPDGYSLKFAGADHWEDIGTPGRTPFGQPDRPGYGPYNIGSQSCPSLLDPPEKYC
jgi:hypothetical protein